MSNVGLQKNKLANEWEERRKWNDREETRGSEDPGSAELAHFTNTCQRKLCSTWLCPHKTIGKYLLFKISLLAL